MGAVERPGPSAVPCSPSGALGVVAASFRAEVQARRSTASPLLHFAVLVGLAALVVPGPDAGHTLVSLGSAPVGLSAETALAAAGAVLGILAVPVYACTLGVGYQRDRRSGVGELLAATGTRPSVVHVGRAMVNLLTGGLVVATAGTGAYVIVLLAYESVPGPAAGAAFVLLALPPAVLAVALGAAGDRLFPFRNVARVAVTMSLWLAVLATAAASGSDLVGLAGLVPGGSESGVGFGLFVTDAVPTVRWEVVQMSSEFLGNRVVALTATVAAVMAMPFVVPASRRGESQRQPRRATANCSEQPIGTPDRTSLPTTVLVTCAEWCRRSPMCVVAFALGLLAPQIGLTSLAVPLALLVPLAAVSRFGDDPGLRDLEWTTAALFRPTPTLFRFVVLVALALASSVFALVDGSLQKGVTVFAAVCGMTLLLVWGHASTRFRRHGILVFVTLWYVGSFGDLHGEGDFLGVSGGSRVASLAWMGWCVVGLVFISISARVAQRTVGPVPSGPTGHG